MEIKRKRAFVTENKGWSRFLWQSCVCINQITGILFGTINKNSYFCEMNKIKLHIILVYLKKILRKKVKIVISFFERFQKEQFCIQSWMSY